VTKRVIFIEHDHVSEGGPIWHQFKARGYEITRFIIVDEEHQKDPNVTVIWPDLLAFDVVAVMGAPYAAYGDDVVGNWLLPELEKMKEVHNAGIPVLGICFGGQLMSRILGGTVEQFLVPHGQNSVGMKLRVKMNHLSHADHGFNTTGIASLCHRKPL